jgi:eukaryotic-like serine/threonine-protein kinase
VADGTSAASGLASDMLRPGVVLADTYEVRSCLGRGGMGQVFEAHDRALNRRVALKVAWPDIDPASLISEARALAAIRHPGLVAVYGLARHADMTFIVMERIYGESLATLVEQAGISGQRVPVDETLHILVSVAETLAAVHLAGIAHRDVKPANVLLPPGGRVVLADFGIFLPEYDPSHATVAGSPHYMAPETIMSGPRRGDLFLVDVYSLGVVAFELLTGDVPYTADNAVAVLQKHVLEPIPDVRAGRADIPPELATLVTEMMAKDPAQRPPSMEWIANQLQAIRRRPARARARALLGPQSY